ncbi:uncharacterized protein LAESUDRAFT_754950 [Laetiporus sulphureus 93-53]|uniref:DUF4219 domain-containing protein n=1 Tax=Laetiporus sulphureus 93-53 TaxID=1314785 RepID=A0A165H5U0_9APHY|nr:uncharacterized protein LAESUDRAFT_754950 [Laetiporus sulphureus 93-53]KZT11283.1 hypothetical protein LAESUDRAFT_754950 [Laetiporus sulphureus 93-53]
MSTESAATNKDAKFMPLNGSNYAQWAMYMEAELTRKGLWEVVEFEYKVGATEAETQKAIEVVSQSTKALNPIKGKSAFWYAVWKRGLKGP